MRIALVAPFGLRAKGTARARALPLGRALARRGHTVALFVPPYDSPEDSGRRWWEAVGAARSGDRPQQKGVEPQQEGVEVINLALPALGRGGAAWHIWLGWRLFLAVRRWQPDVAHVFKPKGPSGLAGALLWATRARRSCSLVSLFPCLHRPCLLIIDSDDWEGPGGWNDDPRAGYTAAQRRFFAWQERYGLSHAHAWTVASQCLAERAIAFGAAPERICVLHNGIEQFAIHNPQSTIRNPQSTILYTRFAGVRPADVADIWTRVRALRPDATLTILGRGVGGEEAALDGLEGITVRGWVEPGELPAALAAATVAIAPWADTPSNRARHSAKVLELMGAGLPVVASAVGELPATLDEAGVLVPPGDNAAFAACVAALLADPARAAALGAAGQARVRHLFNWDALADRALQVYTML